MAGGDSLLNGENGATYFYQAELPYGVTQNQYNNYAGYRVAGNIQKHEGYGIGVYCYFRDYNVTVKSGIVTPAQVESTFVHPLTVFLNGHGGILHVLNDRGNASIAGNGGGQVHYLCN